MKDIAEHKKSKRTSKVVKTENVDTVNTETDESNFII